MNQLPRLGEKELICLLLFTCNYVVSVWRGFLFLWLLGMGYVCCETANVYFHRIHNILFTSAINRLIRRYLDNPDILRVLQPINARQLTCKWNRGGILNQPADTLGQQDKKDVDIQTQSRLSTV